MYVLLNEFKLACKTRLCLAEDNIKSPLFCVMQQTIEFRATSVRPRIVVVAVNVVKLPPLFHCVLQQHCFLVLYAVTIVGLKLLVSVLFG